VVHLKYYFAPEETAYDNATLSQQSDCILRVYLIRIRIRKLRTTRVHGQKEDHDFQICAKIPTILIILKANEQEFFTFIYSSICAAWPAWIGRYHSEGEQPSVLRLGEHPPILRFMLMFASVQQRDCTTIYHYSWKMN
jgi:hypothetical protein